MIKYIIHWQLQRRRKGRAEGENAQGPAVLKVLRPLESITVVM